MSNLRKVAGSFLWRVFCGQQYDARLSIESMEDARFPVRNSWFAEADYILKDQGNEEAMMVE